jgi:hypothetical protein
LDHAKELWDEWEIHCLILVSLSLQVFLFLMADMRRRSGSQVLMTVLWLAYLSADTVAIFVLGHLTVYVRDPSHELMFFWAPFVLVHLGGQETITAFSKQDNELWTRHLLSLVSQVAVAGYVVSKSSWSDTRLRAAMVLMFISGVLKYAGRTLCLYSASPKSLRASSLDRLSNTIKSLQDAQKNRGVSSSGAIKTGAKTRASSLLLLSIKVRFVTMFVPDKCWEYVSQTTDMDADDIMSADAVVNDREILLCADELPDLLEKFQSSPDRCTAYKYLGALLVQSYNVLYTKTPLLSHVASLTETLLPCIGSPQNTIGMSLLLQIFVTGDISSLPLIDNISSVLGVLILLIRIIFQQLLTVIALVLFAAAEKKRHYSQVDIIVSYLLLVGAIVLDLLPVFTSIVSHTRKPFRPGTAAKWAELCLFNCFMWPLGWRTTRQWSEELAQYSMIRRYCTSKSCLPSLRKWIGKCFGAWCVEFFDTTRTPVTDDLKLLVLDKLLLQATRREWDIASFRGERALERWMGSHQVPQPGRSGYAALLNSVSTTKLDFPASVLIWHIATDICCFSEDKEGPVTEPEEAKKKKKREMSRELSLYIMYLVFKCGVMLTTISRLAHEKAHEGLKKFISSHQQSASQVNIDEKEGVKLVFEAMKKEEQRQGSELEQQQSPHKNEEPVANEDDASASTSQLQELLRSTEEALYSPVLSHSRAVAEELLAINDDAARWDLISDVWLEMLYYTAPRCGAAFHYEHLSTGGEFISHVLLLMRNLGPFMPKPGS